MSVHSFVSFDSPHTLYWWENSVSVVYNREGVANCMDLFLFYFYVSAYTRLRMIKIINIHFG